MKKFLLLSILTLLAYFSVVAQTTEEAVFTHYTINPILVNPAVTGFEDEHQIQMNIRTALTTVPGAPKTYAISYNGPVGNTLGLGLNVLSENIGALTNYRVQLNYGFRIPVSDLVKLGAGFSTEFTSRRLSDSVPFDEPDPIVQSNIDGIRFFDAALGVYGEFNEATFAGVSFPNMVMTRLNQIESASGSSSTSFLKSFIFHAGHEIELKDYDIKIEPSVLLRSMENVPFQVDFNVLAKFLDEKFTTGLSYRAGVGGAAGILLGTKVTAFKLYYSYDLSFGEFQPYNGGSHEVTVAFNFDKDGGNNRRTFR